MASNIVMEGLLTIASEVLVAVLFNFLSRRAILKGGKKKLLLLSVAMNFCLLRP